jgi:Fur family peroxide stress response transcriptional regulator
MNTEAIEALLREKGCSITAPRKAILQFLAHNEAHPTAAEIYEAVTRDDLQSSRATVYNTLGLLTEIGAIRAFRVGESETRFDPNTDFHHHVVCPTCGRIQDLPAENVEVRIGGEVVGRATVQLERVCEGCRPGK